MKSRIALTKLEGFQSQSRTIEALPLRIDYQSPRFEHFLRPTESDWLISFSTRKGQWNSGIVHETTNLDPYAVRETFEAVETAEDAGRFLSECGRFWPFEQVLWSQFQEWQAFFQWLRLNPEEARKDPKGLKAWHTAAGRGNSFFAQSDSEFSRARFTTDAIEEIGQARWKEIVRGDQNRLRSLRRFALVPERANEGGQLLPGWYDPNDGHPPEDWFRQREKIAKSGALEPFLYIRALNIVEAIAATIFADRVSCLRHGKCKQCGRLFKIESDHVQKFCPAPSHLNSSPCKNAFLQHERRTNERVAVEFILKARDRELNRTEIQNAAKKDGIRITPSIWEKAKAKQLRIQGN